MQNFEAANSEETYGPLTKYTDKGGEVYAFGPDDPITREQLAVFVRQYAQKVACEFMDVDTAGIPEAVDGDDVSSWARISMAYVRATGIMGGVEKADGVHLYPQRGATRAEAAKMLTVLHRDVMLGKNATSPSEFDYVVYGHGDSFPYEYGEFVVDPETGQYYHFFGPGAYILGYNGRESDVVVPGEIEGMGVVAVYLEFEELASVDLSKTVGLSGIDVSGNKLTELEIPGLDRVWYLDYSVNPKLDASNLDGWTAPGEEDDAEDEGEAEVKDEAEAEEGKDESPAGGSAETPDAGSGEEGEDEPGQTEGLGTPSKWAEYTEPKYSDFNGKWTVHVGAADTSLSFGGGEEICFYSFRTTGAHVVSAEVSDEYLALVGLAKDYWVTVYTYQTGSVDLDLVYDDGTTYTLTITSDDGYMSVYCDWIDEWIAQNITDDMTDKEKVQAVQSMIVRCDYSAENGSGVGMYTDGHGSCLAGASMLYDFCHFLGIPCEVRFAGDDLEKYGLNYGQMEGLFNTFVWLDGEKYLADATPSSYIGLWPWDFD